jgi:hypothetical protein
MKNMPIAPRVAILNGIFFRDHNDLSWRIKSDELVKTLNLLATVIPALDYTLQGQASAGIQQFQMIMDFGSTPQ